MQSCVRDIKRTNLVLRGGVLFLQSLTRARKFSRELMTFSRCCIIALILSFWTAGTLRMRNLQEHFGVRPGAEACEVFPRMLVRFHRQSTTRNQTKQVPPKIIANSLCIIILSQSEYTVLRKYEYHGWYVKFSVIRQRNQTVLLLCSVPIVLHTNEYLLLFVDW